MSHGACVPTLLPPPLEWDVNSWSIRWRCHVNSWRFEKKIAENAPFLISGADLTWDMRHVVHENKTPEVTGQLITNYFSGKMLRVIANALSSEVPSLASLQLTKLFCPMHEPHYYKHAKMAQQSWVLTILNWKTTGTSPQFLLSVWKCSKLAEVLFVAFNFLDVIFWSLPLSVCISFLRIYTKKCFELYQIRKTYSSFSWPVHFVLWRTGYETKGKNATFLQNLLIKHTMRIPCHKKMQYQQQY